MRLRRLQAENGCALNDEVTVFNELSSHGV